MDRNLMIVALGAALYLLLHGPVSRATGLQL
jgi:hypothetical protein